MCKSHLSAVLEDVEAKEQTIAEVESQRETWETRCFKLRVYMRKLTAKCEEWETCYGQQSKLLEAQHHKYIALKSVKTRDTGTSVVSCVPACDTQSKAGHATDELFTNCLSF